MVYYWDTSALLALLFYEKHSQQLRSLVSKNRLPGYTTFFTFIEMESAFSRRITEGSIPADDLTDFRLQIQILEATLGLIWPDIKLLSESRQVILQYGLKPGDAIQLASSIVLTEEKKDVTFVCLDHKLNQAARACGLNILKS